ncbi:Aste57867_4111 [Aphanomyces stellatus]|uniref:Aste57867_4111 protein n=1 Tax=Aphanomyces stellatus TaxID=120398 RepID=A0A485KGA2_9STRA|nr:hypothetical protein As57867_004100 [Aphanomyces stellatus]VFT81242.1 Aste57867_4111 [Aphanomyces stellatus]
MLLLNGNDDIKRADEPSEPTHVLNQLKRKREQSRESKRRWRANEQHMLDSLCHQVAQLKAKLEKATSGDQRRELLVVKTRFYVAQNMQLREALERRPIKAKELAQLVYCFRVMVHILPVPFDMN